jgi:hypothetical protein
MGDRWRPAQLGNSRYIWYPLSWSSGKPKVVAADVWSVNPSAGMFDFIPLSLLGDRLIMDADDPGTYSVASGTTYEAENGSRGGAATALSSSSFSGGKGIGYLGWLFQAETWRPMTLTHVPRQGWHSYSEQRTREWAGAMGCTVLRQW